MDPQSRCESGSRLCRGADRQMTGNINPIKYPAANITTVLLNERDCAAATFKIFCAWQYH